MVITSRVEGRLRVKDDLLKIPSAVESLQGRLRAVSGVHEIAANSRTGSLLVIHDRVPAVGQQVMDTLALVLGGEEKSGFSCADVKTVLKNRLPALPTAAERKRLLHFGLLGSLAVTFLSAVFDLKKLHVASGIGLAVFLVAHLSDKKRFLLPRRRK